MYDVEAFRKTRYEMERIIDTWIFDELTRQILRRKLLDGLTFEKLAEETGYSVKTVQNRFYKGIQVIIQHMPNNKYSKLWKLSFIRPSAEDKNTIYVCWFGKRYIFRKGFGCVGYYIA